MKEYLELVEEVMTRGKPRQGPKPEGTIALTGTQVRYENISEQFPLVTTRDMNRAWEKVIVPELLWIMSGSTNARDLHQYDSTLWDRWAEVAEEKLDYKDGELGPIYGHQLRNFAGNVDQLTQIVGMLRRDPQTRRAMISFWNLSDVETPEGKHIVDVAPCIAMVHFLEMDGKLDMILTQRSADIPIGVPNDVAEWALFQTLVAKEINLPPGDLVHQIHDAHIYNNQIPHMKKLLTREPKPRPTVTIIDSPSGTIYDHRPEDFVLEGYKSHPWMKIPVEL